MKAQLKYSFKKEWAQFARKGKLLGIILAIFGFALMNPLLYKFVAVMLDQMNSMDLSKLDGQQYQAELVAEIKTSSGETPDISGLDGLGFGDMLDAYSSSQTIFSMTLVSLAAYALLIIMLVMRRPAGSEQRKREMIVPLCAGLEYKNYIIPKFVIYPLSIFVFAFLGTLTAGGLCNSMFAADRLSFRQIALVGLMLGVYMAFIITVYLALGLCSSRAGVMVAVVFLGQLFLPSLIAAMGLSKYQPFALLNLISALSEPSLGDILSENLTNILVSCLISIAIGVLMFFVTLAVLNSKRVDNQEEDKPEF